jgi:hypothetical protein
MPWFALVAIVGVAGFIAYERHATCVALIESELRGHRATQISASFQWMDFDSDNFTYEVRYVDATGKACSNTCKVRSRRIPPDNTVFWTRPL